MSEKSQEISLDKNTLPLKIMEEIDKVCKEMKLDEKRREKLTNEVQKVYLNGSFEPGEAIGIISAQSLSEPTTQMTMRTYHFAGSAGLQVTLGLPRIIEIFDARKEPATPSMTIYLKREYNTEEEAEKFAKKIKEKKLKSFLESISLDLTNKRINMELKKVKKSEFDEIVDKLKKRFKNANLKIKENTIRMDFTEGENDEGEITISELQKLKKKLINLGVSGIPGIHNAVVIREDKDWVIKTYGSNLHQVLLLEEVDMKRCYTNNLFEIRDILGIEAAREALFREIKETLSQQGLNVDERHIMLIVDIMVFTGEIKPVGRYGVAGMKSSVLTKAGFEETVKHLVKASVMGEEDNFKGIFENVMINQQVPAGTGMFDLVAKIGED
ncbi:MAG: DNA-directed RNA polymerase subunit A'' [Candidatus Aenigmatarchaeota archaeon]